MAPQPPTPWHKCRISQRIGLEHASRHECFMGSPNPMKQDMAELKTQPLVKPSSDEPPPLPPPPPSIAVAPPVSTTHVSLLQVSQPNLRPSSMSFMPYYAPIEFYAPHYWYVSDGYMPPTPCVYSQMFSHHSILPTRPIYVPPTTPVEPTTPSPPMKNC